MAARMTPQTTRATAMRVTEMATVTAEDIVLEDELHLVLLLLPGEVDVGAEVLLRNLVTIVNLTLDRNRTIRTKKQVVKVGDGKEE